MELPCFGATTVRLLVTVMLLCFLTSRSLALDVYWKSHSDKTLLFDASLKGHWKYHLDKLKSSYDALKHVDLTSDGKLVKASTLDCGKLTTNPFRLSVSAHTNSIRPSPKFGR